MLSRIAYMIYVGFVACLLASIVDCGSITIPQSNSSYSEITFPNVSLICDNFNLQCAELVRWP